ncbi:MAG: zinc-dependent metalloprotease [Betaproteobacteria bacterium]|nr:zinc-dependent metalloprotease [Betaproteobacteria bacterium]
MARSLSSSPSLVAVSGCARAPQGPATAAWVRPAPRRPRPPHRPAGRLPRRTAPRARAPDVPAPARRPRPGAALPRRAAGRHLAPVRRRDQEAKETKGYFTLWQKDEKVWIEIAPGQFDKPMFFSVNLASGIGENFLFGGLMGRSYIAEFRRIGSTVQLVARNDRFFARPSTPEATAVAEGFSDSLLASAPTASQPHPERKSVLVDLGAMLSTDIPGAYAALDRAFRQPYAIDARNTNVTRVRTSADAVSVLVNAHYAVSRLVQPPPTAAPGATGPSAPTTLPDPRSLFLGFQYNLAKLPDEPMRPRVADARVGYFTVSRFDYSDTRTLTPRVNLVKRWRLEKKDPAAELSEPKQPIVFWIDRNVPLRYRDTIVAGVLEWNKAFERIGFKDAVQARIQPDDADFDTLDARHASIRWMTTARPAFGGIGPSQADPRTGEILDADIGIDPTRLRFARYRLADSSTPSPAPASSPLGFPQGDAHDCRIEDFVAEDRGFASDLLAARGVIAPDSPEAEEFVLSDLREVTMHEVGHALGLTHNFRASTVYTQAQLNDAEFTRKNGVSGSVMEYTPINLALRGEPQGTLSMTTLGPYDYWAIEYAYRPIAPEREADELAKIAARSSEPLLAYAYDDESNLAIDPEATPGDLGSDPLAYAARRIELAKELWERWEARPLEPGETYAALRRNISRGITQMRESGLLASRYIGGTSVLRDAAGSGRTPLNPVAMAKQRDALKLIETGVFAADSFRFKPEFLRSLSVDFLDRGDSFGTGLAPTTFDFSLPAQVLAAQKAVLDRVMSETVAQRVLDAEGKVDRPGDAVQLAEIYASLHRAIWSELRTGRDIPLIRRNLQREHATRLATALLKPSGSMPADARALLRADAKALRAEIAAAAGRPGLSPAAAAHLAEALSTLDEALKAPLVRSAA